MSNNSASFGNELFKTAVFLSGVKDNATAASSLKAEPPLADPRSLAAKSLRADQAKPKISDAKSDGASVECKQAADPKIDELKLDLSNQTLLNAIIMSEVLGKPKCMRKGR